MNDRVFKNIFGVFEHLQSIGWTVNWHTPPYFECMELYDNRSCFAPMPMTPLYRGQNAYYEPSLPSIYRRKKSSIEELKQRLLHFDFKLILSDHPEIQELENAEMFVNYKGLAQHYGIDTDVIDLTNSALVAAFFATTDYDYRTDTYSPVMEKIRKGVVYFFPMGGVLNNLFDASSKIWPIGLDALHRPGEQRGYGLECETSLNLNRYPDCHKFFFWHDPIASQRIYHQCNYGRSLFPYDPMAEKVRMMKKLNIYS